MGFRANLNELCDLLHTIDREGCIKIDKKRGFMSLNCDGRTAANLFLTGFVDVWKFSCNIKILPRLTTSRRREFDGIEWRATKSNKTKDYS